MTPEQRKALMILEKVKVTDIADQCGVTATMVYLVRKNLSRSLDVETAMADACGVPLSEMFPEPCNRRSAA